MSQNKPQKNPNPQSLQPNHEVHLRIGLLPSRKHVLPGGASDSGQNLGFIALARKIKPQ